MTVRKQTKLAKCSWEYLRETQVPNPSRALLLQRLAGLVVERIEFLVRQHRIQHLHRKEIVESLLSAVAAAVRLQVELLLGQEPRYPVSHLEMARVAHEVSRVLQH